jgi:hypothetical protein
MPNLSTIMSTFHELVAVHLFKKRSTAFSSLQWMPEIPKRPYTLFLRSRYAFHCGVRQLDEDLIGACQ